MWVIFHLLTFRIFFIEDSCVKMSIVSLSEFGKILFVERRAVNAFVQYRLLRQYERTHKLHTIRRQPFPMPILSLHFPIKKESNKNKNKNIKYIFFNSSVNGVWSICRDYNMRGHVTLDVTRNLWSYLKKRIQKKFKKRKNWWGNRGMIHLPGLQRGLSRHSRRKAKFSGSSVKKKNFK